MTTRPIGPPAFEEIFTVDPSSKKAAPVVHPLLVYDTDGDGLSEILLGGCDRLYPNLGGGKFRQETLCKFLEPITEIGVVTDFNNDGRVDFVTVDRPIGNVLAYDGDHYGKFTSRPRGRPIQPAVDRPSRFPLRRPGRTNRLKPRRRKNYRQGNSYH